MRTRQWIQIAAAILVFGTANAQDAKLKLDIKPQPIRLALQDFGEQSGLQILFRSDGLAMDGLTSPQVSGELSAQQALDRLLSKTGLRYEFINSHTVRISSASDSPIKTTSDQSYKVENTGLMLAQTATPSAPIGNSQNSTESSAQGPVPSSEGVGTKLSEIVVTAEKRASTVQKTPISMTAISGQDLTDHGLTSVAEAVGEVPGVSFRTSGPGQSQFVIRGISAGGGESPTVGFYLDETAITPPTSSTNGKVTVDPNLYDLARIEVLRGPQGTLYGAGAMGGTIKLVTNPPDPTGFRSSGESILSGTPAGGVNYGQNAMVNLPFANGEGALRIVGTYSHTSGWLDRVVEANFPLSVNHIPNGQFYGTIRGNVLAAPSSKIYSNVNNENLQGVRGSILIRPTDKLSITAGVFYQRIGQAGQNLYDSVPGTNASYQPFDVAEPYSDTFLLYSAAINYDMDWGHLTSATSYYSRRTSVIQDNSEALQNGLNLPGYAVAVGGFGAVRVFEYDPTRQFSQELRLSSNDSDLLQWIFGGYYSFYKYVADTGSAFPQVSVLSGGLTKELFESVSPTKIKQKALFGNINYQLFDQVKLTAGLRYFSYQNDIAGIESGLIYTGSSATLTTTGSASNSGFNPMGTISYAPTNNLLFYVTAAKGFREGAGNFPVPTTGATGFGPQCLADLQALGRNSAPTSYQPDTVWSYEVGEKAKLFDQRVTVNGALYDIKWSKTQQQVALPCGLAFTDNAANAEAKGGELEINAIITPGIRAVQSLSYSDAAYVTGSLETATLPGQKLLQAPNWTISSSLEYSKPLGEVYGMVARIENSFVGASYDTTYARNLLHSRDLASLRLGLVSEKKMSGFLFVNNLFDRKLGLSNTNLYTFNLPTYNRVATNQPRTIGIDIIYHF